MGRYGRNGRSLAIAAAFVAAAALAPGAGSGITRVAIRPCSTQQLRIHYVAAASVATVTRVRLAYTNVSASRCSVAGWPRVVARDSNGRTRIAIRTGMLPTFQPELRDESRAPGVPIVVLAHRESAYSFLAADGIYSNSTKSCPKYVRLSVAPPHNARTISLSGWVAANLNGFIPACARPAVSQVVPRSVVR
jgi:hypothetical protein